MKTESPAPAPLVSDEEITRKATIQSDAVMAMHKDDFAAGERARGYVNGAVDVKDVYESELTKMRAERDELVYALRHSALAMNVVRSSLTSAAKRLRLQNGLDKAQAVLSKYKTE